MADEQEGVDAYLVYIAVTGGAWETVPYQSGLIIENFASRIPFGITRVYVKAVSGEIESEAKMRTVYRTSISLVTAGTARVTEYISWW